LPFKQGAQDATTDECYVVLSKKMLCSLLYDIFSIQKHVNYVFFNSDSDSCCWTWNFSGL